MKKKLLLLASLFMLSYLSFSQFKLYTSGGISTSLNNKPDSINFANSNGVFININPSYYWGKLGLGLKTGVINYAAQQDFGTVKPPQIDSFRLKQTKGGGLQSALILLGPEICICYEKIRITPTIKAGIVVNSMQETEIVMEQVAFQRFYNSELNKPTSFALNAGANLAYKLSKKIAVAFNIDYVGYKVNTNLRDYRNGSTIKNILQPRKLLNMGLGFNANF